MILEISIYGVVAILSDAVLEHDGCKPLVALMLGFQDYVETERWNLTA